jgi:dTMP kinase
MTGRFITFEGIDGAGKSTQLELLLELLHRSRVEALRTREPGGTPFGEDLRDLILRHPMDSRAETLAMFAARAEHVSRVILPALAAGRWVVCDRFTDATYAYQCGGRGLPEDDVAALERWVHPNLQPDLTFLVDVEPEVAAARLAQARAADRFESETTAFFARVRGIYLARAAREPQRFCVLNGSADRERLHEDIALRVGAWLR